MQNALDQCTVAIITTTEPQVTTSIEILIFALRFSIDHGLIRTLDILYMVHNYNYVLWKEGLTKNFNL